MEANEFFKECKDLYRFLFYSMNDAVFVFVFNKENNSNRIIKVNSAATKIFGYSKEEFLTMSIDHINCQESKNEFIDIMNKLNDNENVIFQQTFITKNGDKIPVEISANPIVSNNKLGVLAIVRNISYRKNIENELITKSFALESAAASVAITDMSGKIIYVNNAFIKLFKYNNKDQIIGNILFNFIKNPDNFKKIIDSIHKKEQDQIEKKILCKGNTELETQIFISLIKDKFNNNLGIMTSYLDISDKNKYEKELIIAKEKAEESEKLKSAFLANMSHEIRTPMNGIIGFADLLNDIELTSDERKYYTSIIIKSGYQLLNIVNDILDISKIDSGQLKINIDKININNMFNEILLTFIEKAKTKNINIFCKKEFDDKKSYIYSDETRLKQILSNLINNSLKFTNEGFIKFGYYLEGQNLIFYVEDTGIGIRKEFYNNIFKRFSQSDSDNYKVSGGTGLGLSICKGLAELLGGKIWFESFYKKGSSFYFSIPYSINEKSEYIEIKNVLKKNSILVAEDEVINYLFLEKILSKKGFDVIHAKNGKEALKIINANHDIKLILMDIKMPEMNGIEAAEIIKKEYPDLPVVAVTAYAMKEEEEKILESGLEAYISKPINTKKLFEIISKYIKK